MSFFSFFSQLFYLVALLINTLFFSQIEECSVSTGINDALLTQLFNVSKEEATWVTKDLSSLRVSPKNVTFRIFTADNKSLLLNTSKTINLLKPSYPTKMITHGWLSNSSSSWLEDMAYLYHQKGNYNTILVDWSPHAKKNYIHAAAVTSSIGSIIGDCIMKISKNRSINLLKLHLIGHSLGAHVFGFAGKRVKHLKDEVDRITGLDAAGPFFDRPTLKGPNCRLAKGDASFVDLIHTTNAVGVSSSLGDIDFYVKGGLVQPQCVSNNIYRAVACGHQSSYNYFMNTILEPEMYIGVACDNTADFKRGKCDGKRTAVMGDEVSRNASGDFYLTIDENGLQKE